MLTGAGLAMIIGPFLPWVTATAPFAGTISRSGMDYGEVGIVTMAGLALLAVTYLLRAGVNVGLWWPVAATWRRVARSSTRSRPLATGSSMLGTGPTF